MLQSETYYREAPKVTVFLFAYNQERFIEAACRSVLTQDYDKPMQIVFSDDCSQDDTFAIMTAIAEGYEGIHTLSLNRNSKNLGLINHVNLSYKLSTGDLIIAAAGDDISSPNRVTENVKAFRLSEKLPMSLYSAVYEMSESGEVGQVRKPPYTKPPAIKACATSASIVIGAAHAWHRNVFDTFGDITELGAYEDLVIAYRSALLDGLVYIDLPLIAYRLDVGISQVINGSEENLDDMSIYRGRIRRYTNIMLPVLAQRLKDSLLINDKDAYVIDLIKKEILKQEVDYKIIVEKNNLIELLLNSKNPITKLLLIKAGSKVAIRKAQQLLKN
ncbi:glycosyltransferase family 2 protein [Psychrobacter celer]|uniref:glycosyltransferase family 2 protein n=1 Tax=Psychrobacter celer TaxID=306572 RepID=UPI003FCF4105